MNKIIITLVLLIILLILFNLKENIIILSSIIIILLFNSLFYKKTYEKFTTQVSTVTTCTNTNITIDGKTIQIEAFNNIMDELNKINE
jgi:hypothetical protein